MTETLETLAKRLTLLEKVVAEMTLQLSGTVDISKSVDTRKRKTGDKQSEVQAIKKCVNISELPI